MQLDPAAIIARQSGAPTVPRVHGAAEPVRIIRDGSVPQAECPHCGGELQVATVGSTWKIRRPSDVADRLMLQLGALEREELHVLLLNTRHLVLAQERVYQGNLGASVVRVGELFTEAVRRGARSVLLVHNHPSGDTTPSPEDLNLTAEAIAAGRLLDIAVLDHIIVAGGSWVSLRDEGFEFDDRHHDRHHGPGEVAESREPYRRRARLALHVEEGLVKGEDGRVYDVAAAIAAIPWVTALPSSGSPHQYAVDRRCPDEAWDVLTSLIAKHPDSYRAYHRGYARANRYLDIGAHRYWRTASSGYGGFTEMLNRCLLESDTPRRVDQGAKPADWAGGPAWLAYGAPWPPGWIVENGRRVYHAELDPRASFCCLECGRKMFWEPGRVCPKCGTLAPEELA